MTRFDTEDDDDCGEVLKADTTSSSGIINDVITAVIIIIVFLSSLMRWEYVRGRWYLAGMKLFQSQMRKLRVHVNEK